MFSGLGFALFSLFVVLIFFSNLHFNYFLLEKNPKVEAHREGLRNG